MQSIEKQINLLYEDEYLAHVNKEQIINYLNNGEDINKIFIDTMGNNIGNLLFINQNQDTLNELINRGININCLDYQGRNCLWFIKENKIWETLISKGININQQKRYFYEKNLLMDAAITQNYDKVEILINNNIDLNVEDSKGSNVVFQCPSDEILFNLLKNQKISFESVTRHILCLTESISIAKYLIEEKSVDINKTYKCVAEYDWKTTALMLNQNPEVCNLLISYGADVNKKDSMGRNALFYNAFQNAYNTKNGYKKAEILLKNGIDINNNEETGENVLFYQVDEKLLQLYKKYNINMECLDNNKNNAITRARNIEKAELLYQYGCSIQKKFKQYEVEEVGIWAKKRYQEVKQAKKEKIILAKMIKNKNNITLKKRL